MNTETDTTKVYYVVTWKAIALEYCFINNAQYLDAIAVAESSIITMLRERGATIPTLKVHIAGLLDALARGLVDIVRPMGVNVDGIPCYKIPALTQEDLSPVWGEQRGENYQRWFSYYHMLKKFKFVGDHCGEEQIFYTEPEPEVLCGKCGSRNLNGQCYDCEICVPCGRCSKHFIRDFLIDWETHPQVCPPCVEYLLGDDEEEEEEPVQKKKNQKIGMCAVCLTETHRRCACREIYYCSTVCSKADWKAHKKTCCYDGR